MILRKFNNTPGNLETFEANAKSLIQQRKNGKRSNERDELVTYMDSFGDFRVKTKNNDCWILQSITKQDTRVF